MCPEGQTENTLITSLFHINAHICNSRKHHSSPISRIDTHCRKLALEGASVIVNGRTQQRVDQASASAQSGARGSTSGLAADLGTAESVGQAIEHVPNVDILVNNLGIFEPKAFAISPTQIGCVFSSQRDERRAAQPFLFSRMKRRIWGARLHLQRFSLTNSRRNDSLWHDQNCQLAISRGLAESTAGTNVTVNSVMPGPTGSEGVFHFVDQLAAQENRSRLCGERFLSVRAAFFVVEAHVRPQRNRIVRSIYLQSICFRNQRRRTARRRRRGSALIGFAPVRDWPSPEFAGWICAPWPPEREFRLICFLQSSEWQAGMRFSRRVSFC